MNEDIENREDIQALRRDIEETRHRISGEVEELSERLTPEHAKHVAKERLLEAKDRAISRASERAHTAVRNTGDVIRDNPIPSAMIAVGAGWLLWEAFRPTGGPVHERIEGARSDARERYEHGRERAQERVDEYRDRARTAYSSASESVRSSAMTVKSHAGELYDRGRHGAQQAYVRTQDAYDTNPIAFGAVALLAGIGLGMVLPHTQREDRLLGERRQRAIERARHMAQDAREVAVESAKEGYRAARERAKEEIEEHPDLPHPPR